MTTTKQLSDAGIATRLDVLTFSRPQTLTLRKLVEGVNVVGVATNPSAHHPTLTTGSGYGTVTASCQELLRDVEIAPTSTRKAS